MNKKLSFLLTLFLLTAGVCNAQISGRYSAKDTIPSKGIQYYYLTFRPDSQFVYEINDGWKFHKNGYGAYTLSDNKLSLAFRDTLEGKSGYVVVRDSASRTDSTHVHFYLYNLSQGALGSGTIYYKRKGKDWQTFSEAFSGEATMGYGKGKDSIEIYIDNVFTGNKEEPLKLKPGYYYRVTANMDNEKDYRFPGGEVMEFEVGEATKDDILLKQTGRDVFVPFSSVNKKKPDNKKGK